jgi:hypothetical protein
MSQTQTPKPASIFPGGTPQQILNAVQQVLSVVQAVEARVRAIEEKLERKK